MRLRQILISSFGGLLLAVWGVGPACAVDSFLNRKEEGWFWYQDPPEPPKPEEAKKEPPPPPPKEEPKKEEAKKEEDPKPPLFSVEWFRKNLSKLRDQAIDDPSSDNVAAYLYAQRVMLERADNFASASTRMSQTDPYLDENNRVPVTTAMRALTMRAEASSQKEAFKELAKKSGLFFFFDSRCKFCVMQRQMVNAFADQYGFIVHNISLDGKPLPGMTEWRTDTGKFRELGLSITPTVVLAVPPDQYLVITQGTMSIDAFEGRILVAAEDRALLPPEVLRTTRAYDRGRIPPETLKQLGIAVDPDDPKAWIDFIRKTLNAAY